MKVMDGIADQKRHKKLSCVQLVIHEPEMLHVYKQSLKDLIVLETYHILLNLGNRYDKCSFVFCQSKEKWINVFNLKLILSQTLYLDLFFLLNLNFYFNFKLFFTESKHYKFSINIIFKGRRIAHLLIFDNKYCINTLKMFPVLF